MCNPVGEAPLSSTPLLEALLRHREKGRMSFHTPGHKGKDSLLAPLLSLELDLTELPDTGSLYDGGDAIEQSERRAFCVIFLHFFTSAITMPRGV